MLRWFWMSCCCHCISSIWAYGTQTGCKISNIPYESSGLLRYCSHTPSACEADHAQAEFVFLCVSQGCWTLCVLMKALTASHTHRQHARQTMHRLSLCVSEMLNSVCPDESTHSFSHTPSACEADHAPAEFVFLCVSQRCWTRCVLMKALTASHTGSPERSAETSPAHYRCTNPWALLNVSEAHKTCQQTISIFIICIKLWHYFYIRCIFYSLFTDFIYFTAF